MKKQLHRFIIWLDAYWHVYVCNFVERITTKEENEDRITNP